MKSGFFGKKPFPRRLIAKDLSIGTKIVPKKKKKRIFTHTERKGTGFATEICTKRKVFDRVLASGGAWRYNQDDKRGAV
jgi:hypothetical protein